MKKLLVTGAGGYIGSITSDVLLSQGFEIIAVDNFLTGHMKPLIFLQEKFGESSIRFYTLDLQKNLDKLFEKEKNIDGVIHLAGVCHVDESMKNPFKYFSNNFFATLNLLEAMKNNNIPSIIFSSTCNVYKSATANHRLTETDPLEPINPYGESKLMAERTIQWYNKLFDLQYIILRFFNVCGAETNGLLGDSKNPSTLLIHNAVLGAMGIRPFSTTFPSFPTPDESPIRDYVDVLDLADAHSKAILYLASGKKSEIINLGSGTGYSVLETIKIVEKTFGIHLNVKKGKIRSGEYEKRIASNNRAKKLLAWKPKRTIEESIHATMLWYKMHPGGWCL